MKPDISASPAEIQQLRQKINQAHQVDKPPFLPVANPDFLKCSNALQHLLPDKHDYRDTKSRMLPLPSRVLPPPY